MQVTTCRAKTLRLPQRKHILQASKSEELALIIGSNITSNERNEREK